MIFFLNRNRKIFIINQAINRKTEEKAFNFRDLVVFSVVLIENQKRRTRSILKCENSEIKASESTFKKRL